ncbi:MAG: bestrophin family protein [Aureliella sp.]
MIVLDKRSWIRMVFAVRGSSLQVIFPRVLMVTAFATAATWAFFHYELVHYYSLTTTPFSLVGVALSIFLGFRNNESYDRFWEGRKLWGRMVNVSRSFTRQVLTLVVSPEGAQSECEQLRARQEKIVRTTVAYVDSFRHHLRGSDPREDLEKYMSEEEIDHAMSHSNVPIAILQQLGDMVRGLWQEKAIHDFHVPVFEGSLTEMTGIQGGCERIKHTPVPFTYNVLIHRIVAIYCLALPFGLIQSVGVLTPVVVCLISYAFFGLDAIGDEVEQPFELDDNDLPLEGMSRTIEINLLEAISADEIPEPTKPVGGVLY